MVALAAGAVIVCARRGGCGRERRDLRCAGASSCSRFSILYLFLLFAVLLVDDRLGRLLGRSSEPRMTIMDR